MAIPVKVVDYPICFKKMKEAKSGVFFLAQWLKGYTTVLVFCLLCFKSQL